MHYFQEKFSELVGFSIDSLRKEIERYENSIEDVTRFIKASGNIKYTSPKSSSSILAKLMLQNKKSKTLQALTSCKLKEVWDCNAELARDYIAEFEALSDFILVYSGSGKFTQTSEDEFYETVEERVIKLNRYKFYSDVVIDINVDEFVQLCSCCVEHHSFHYKLKALGYECFITSEISAEGHDAEVVTKNMQNSFSSFSESMKDKGRAFDFRIHLISNRLISYTCAFDEWEATITEFKDFLAREEYLNANLYLVECFTGKEGSYIIPPEKLSANQLKLVIEKME